MRPEVPAVQAEYIDVSRARALPGLRLVLTAGVPGPWGEAAKGIFHAKKIPFARVAQSAGASNDEIVEWTGHRNAPTAMYEDEPARTTWREILWLAERLQPEPALLPAEPEDRVRCLGLSEELMGVGGFGWSRRLTLLRPGMGDTDTPPEAMRETLGRMARQYGYSRAAAEEAPERLAQTLTVLSRQLASQRAKGRRYLVGDQLSAVDIYWAAMAALVAPLPADVCAMPEMLRGLYGNPGPIVAKALDPALLEHRDRVYREHMEFPLAL
jgi:glutathione S-transferase